MMAVEDSEVESSTSISPSTWSGMRLSVPDLILASFTASGSALGTAGQALGGAVNTVQVIGSVAAQDEEIVSCLGAFGGAEVGIDDLAVAE